MKKIKKRVYFTLFLYIAVIILSCDIDSPEAWETPTWHIPLSFPLIDKEYSFSGIADSIILFVDDSTNVIQIVFSDSLAPNGFPDSIFNIKMSSSQMAMPDLGIGGGEPIDIPAIPSESLEIPIPIDIDLSALDCFPVNFLDSLEAIPDQSGSIGLDFEIDNALVEVKKVVIIDGVWDMSVTNNLPFTITSVDFSISNGGQELYSTTLLTEIDPYTTKNDPQPISVSNPTIIDVTDSLRYSAVIYIDPNQSGEDGLECPDINNPPVYICNEDITSGVYQFDDTCEGNCELEDCSDLYYCDGNLEDIYPSEDCILPDSDSEIPLAFICGDDISSLYFTDLCSGVCDISECNQIYYCYDDFLSQYLTFTDNNCSTGTDDSFVCSNDCISGEYVSCAGECSAGNYVGGWEINNEISPGMDLSFQYSFDQIGSVVVDLLGIDTSLSVGQPIPGFSGVTIKQAKINEYIEEYPNQLLIDITNGLFADFVLNFDFINFFNEETGDYLTEDIVIPAYDSISTAIDFSDYILADGWESDEAIDSMTFNINAKINSGEYTIEVENNQIEIGVPTFNQIEMGNMRLEYIAAITDSLGFPTVDSPPIEDIPQGFSGFKFYDIIMQIELFNEIAIPVGLQLELSGSKSNGDSLPPVNISTVINTPYYLQENYECDYSVIGDTAKTLIYLNKDSQITEYYCKTFGEPAFIESTSLDSEEQSSIVDLLNFAPEIINFGGAVQIDGEGILAPGTQVWGTFTLIAPLAFIFENPITIIPADFTEIEPMDTSTANQINSALIEASLNVEITNSSPLGGSLSLLVSDSTIFPIFLDSLITGSWEKNINYQIENYGFELNTEIWDTLSIEIDSIYYEEYDTLDINNTTALLVEFYNDSILQFFIGRMFELSFPATDSINPLNGFVNPDFAKVDTSFLTIDTTRISWITTENPRYLSPMITFDSSQGDPRTFQTTNYVGVRSYLTFILNTGGLFREEKIELYDKKEVIK